MILDFFGREGEASQKLENYGRSWWRIMQFGLFVIMSNIYYGCISVADSLIGSVTKRGGNCRGWYNGNKRKSGNNIAIAI